MKISYKTLKRYIKNIKSPEEIAEDLVMHSAEVESVKSELEGLKSVLTWKLKSYQKVEWSNKLHVWQFDFWKEWIKQIIFWSVFGLEIWEVYPIAIAPTTLPTWIEIKKTKMLWVESFWMVCADEELWTSYTDEWLIRLAEDTPLWVPAINIINWTEPDIILEIDNKAINHRPDMFSHIWVIRDICAISWYKFDFKYEQKNFSNLNDLWIKNEIPKLVNRFIGLKISNVENKESPDYIKEILKINDVALKWILIDMTNYSLYLYWKPTHCYDADKIKWNITIRFAKDWEEFLALNDKTYKLSKEDIVIADESSVISLAWIIGWKNSAVSQSTKNIIIESANFDHSTLRKTWKRLWIRTDSLNLFEKDLLPEMTDKSVSLLVWELEKNIWKINLEKFSDIYEEKQKEISIDFDIKFINKLIGKNYEEKYAIEILENLEIKVENKKAKIPFWRKDLETKADLAEEISRIDWYNKINMTIPRVNLWAVIQDNIYKIKILSRNFLTSIWYFEVYNYSFVNSDLMSKLALDTSNLIWLKNELSEELTHMRDSLLPNLMLSLEKNIREEKNLKLFELEKVFKLNNKKEISENYCLSWVFTNDSDLIYYELQNDISNLLISLSVDKYSYSKPNIMPVYSHRWRTAEIIVRWESVWIIWEINPKVAKNFDVNQRVWFFEIDLDKLKNKVLCIKKYKEISSFQEVNFDISFIVSKQTKASDILQTIKNSDSLIINTEIFDIYEDKEKLKDKRSISFKVYLQSTNETINDETKNKIIENIIKKVEKKWWELR